MRIRKVDANGDMVFGQSQANYWKDVPDAPALLTAYRLHMWEGQWYLDTADGTPYVSQVLGKHTELTRDVAIRARIQDTPGITDIAEYSSVLNRENRGFSITTTLNTDYGATRIVESI